MKTMMLLGALAVSTASGAIVTQYANLGAFTAFVGTTQTFSFGDPDGTTVTNLGTAALVTTLAGDAFGKAQGGGLCGSTGNSVDCFKAAGIFFSPGVTGVAFNNLDLTTDEEAVVILGFSNGDPNQYFFLNLGGAAEFTPIFFGASSNVPINFLAVYSRNIGSNSDPGTRANVIDDIVIPLAVPEPSTGISLGAGLLLAIGLASFRKTRRQRRPSVDQVLNRLTWADR